MTRSRKKTEEGEETGRKQEETKKRKKGGGGEEIQKKPRGRPKGSKNKSTLAGSAMELGFAAAAQALSLPGGGGTALMTSLATDEEELKPIERGPIPKAREVRLEQNRKAARESRRRKKVMVEELQRSVHFFSRANGTLKAQNEEFERLLIQAREQVTQLEANGGAQESNPSVASQGPSVDATGRTDASIVPVDSQAAQQAIAAAQAAQLHVQFGLSSQAQQAQAAAMQASYEKQGFPPAAARAAAQTFTPVGDGNGSDGQPVMQFDPQAMMAMHQQWQMNPTLFQQQWQMMAQQVTGGGPVVAPPGPNPSASAPAPADGQSESV